MIFADYQEMVLNEYERKKAAGELSHRMIRLTCAKFKEECEVVLSQRYDRRDEKTLEEFFGPVGGDKTAWLKAIRDSNPDDFRPLVNFLKRKTRWPDKKVVELLAWLIKFDLRPHDPERRYDTSHLDMPAVKEAESPKKKNEQEKEAGSGEDFGQGGTQQKPVRSISAKSVPGPEKRRMVIAGIILAVAIAGVYLAWSKTFRSAMGKGQACMFWAGDHYQEISCSQRLGDTLILPLDREKLATFKKITQPDTITENALGSIWYAKFNGIYECYTAHGNHPIDTSLKLKLLTDYVLIKHIHANKEAGNTPQ